MNNNQEFAKYCQIATEKTVLYYQDTHFLMIVKELDPEHSYLK